MYTPSIHTDEEFSRHALMRIGSRRLSLAGIDLVQRYGREVFARGAVFCFIGRKEVAAHADLAPLEGVHVLLAHDGTVLTAYRNRGFHPNRYRKAEHRPRHGKARRRGR